MNGQCPTNVVLFVSTSQRSVIGDTCSANFSSSEVYFQSSSRRALSAGRYRVGCVFEFETNQGQDQRQETRAVKTMSPSLFFMVMNDELASFSFQHD